MPSPLLLLSYGAPERPEDVVPFLHNILSGKDVADARITAAAQKYNRFAERTGYYSPLNAECRKLILGIRQIMPELTIYWGNLFWHPLLTDTVAEMSRDGVEHAFCFVTSAFDSPSGNLRYADALSKASGANPPIKIEKMPLPFEHPLFIEAQTERLLEAIKQAGQRQHSITRGITRGGMLPSRAYILFSAHSIPLVDSSRSHYVEQLQSVCRSVIKEAVKTMGHEIPWELVYQSRSGASEHWLGPNIEERVGDLAKREHIESIIVSPIGFFCENMETEYDLDIDIGEWCSALGCDYHRAKAVGAMPQVCRMISEFMLTESHA